MAADRRAGGSALHRRTNKRDVPLAMPHRWLVSVPVAAAQPPACSTTPTTPRIPRFRRRSTAPSFRWRFGTPPAACKLSMAWEARSSAPGGATCTMIGNRCVQASTAGSRAASPDCPAHHPPTHRWRCCVAPSCLGWASSASASSPTSCRERMACRAVALRQQLLSCSRSSIAGISLGNLHLRPHQ